MTHAASNVATVRVGGGEGHELPAAHAWVSFDFWCSSDWCRLRPESFTFLLRIVFVHCGIQLRTNQKSMRSRSRKCLTHDTHDRSITHQTLQLSLPWRSNKTHGRKFPLSECYSLPGRVHVVDSVAADWTRVQLTRGVATHLQEDLASLVKNTIG